MHTRDLIVGARIIDGTGTRPWGDGYVAIEDGTIVDVGGGRIVEGESSWKVIDVEGRTVMPGLIDAHTHLTYHAGEYALLLQQMNESLEFNTVKAVETAALLVSMGCTAVGDGGARGHIATAIRDAVARRVIAGPKVVAAGQMLCGSAGIQDHTAAWGYYDADAFLGTVVNGPDEVTVAVRKQVREGVDWIKVTASGTPGNPWIGGSTQDLEYEELRAAVQEAQKFGKLVHAHAHDKSGIAAAVRAGVVSLHSGEFADTSCLQMMLDTGCVFVATVAWLRFRTSPDYVERYLRVYETTQAQRALFTAQCAKAYEAAEVAIQEAHRLGVRLAIGTDAAHVFPPQDIVAEMEYFQRLGLPPLTILVAATSGSAAAIGKASSWGSVQPGRSADLLVVDGRPDEDVRVLGSKDRIQMIIQDGRVLKDSLMAWTPTE